jgi:acetylglutamate kinase
MQEFIEKAKVLAEALPYIREFSGKTIVVKYGGSAMDDPAMSRLTAQDVVLMKYVGMNPVVVHGGGPHISATLKKLDVESHFHNGLRVTSQEAVQVVEMVLAGSVNKNIVSLINQAGGSALGLCGKDANLLHAKKVELPDGVDVGQVGQIEMVNASILNVLCEAETIPVIAPIATDSEGQTWNVNADTAASEIAGALKAEKLVFMTDTPGLLRDVNELSSLIHQLKVSEIQELTDRGVIAGGMIPKVAACQNALEHGVQKAHIIDGRVTHALLLEIFTQSGLGTLVMH